MVRRLFVMSLVFAAVSALGSAEALAQRPCTYQTGHPNAGLFHNYYVGPGMCCDGVGAQLYVSPRPVPASVGHTYITYEPLMPHEFMYRHHRVYWRFHGRSGGATRTSVRWW